LILIPTTGIGGLNHPFSVCMQHWARILYVLPAPGCGFCVLTALGYIFSVLCFQRCAENCMLTAYLHGGSLKLLSEQPQFVPYVAFILASSPPPPAPHTPLRLRRPFHHDLHVDPSPCKWLIYRIRSLTAVLSPAFAICFGAYITHWTETSILCYMKSLVKGIDSCPV
jgi:hypothetical protein